MSEKQKIIRDLVHGYISISNEVDRIIDDESYQRLKYIKQTTAYHLYPSANHTRFEHSLGVMKLADDFFNKLRDQFKKKYGEIGEKDIKNKMKCNCYHLKYAALLHDVGHAPLSHLGERFYSMDAIKTRIAEQLNKFDTNKLAKGSAHEWMSVLVIICNFYEKLNEIFEKKKIEIDYEYIARIITGNKYEDSENNDLWDRNLIISIINSDTIDVDKLDYLMRDNFMSGMVGPNIDIERLLHSLVITNNRELGFSKVGISAIQKIIECRDSIYLWVCNHHTIVYTDYLIEECIKHMSNLYDFDKYKEALNREDYFSVDAILKKRITDNEIYERINYTKYLADQKELTAYTERIINQLMDRNFLKPVWKTIYEYKQFIETNFLENERKQAIEFITRADKGYENRRKIVKIICEKADCKLGEVFLVVRSNKFYSMPQLSSIFIYSYDGKGEEIVNSIDKLLPQKDYQAMYNEITFYLYCRKEKREKVTEVFKDIMNDCKKIDSIYRKIIKL